ncbi:MAG: rhodanese-like domain-containing protein [Desulfuromonadales bacterium]|nr:rhodanese-like domain-containing protein [Desulfuromonadales bacterium]
MKYLRMLLFVLFLAAPSFPAFGSGVGDVTSLQLKAMIDRNEPGLVLIDSRSLNQYEEAHIKGAISIPLEEMGQNPELPKARKDARLVFYCSGNT